MSRVKRVKFYNAIMRVRVVGKELMLEENEYRDDTENINEQ